jgi:hypothetical protein
MKRSSLLILFTVAISSCEPVSSEIGADFFTDGVLDFSYIDSATVKLSTIQLQDMVTSAAGRMLVGTYHDKNLGKLTATPFFEVAPSEKIDLRELDIIYDHLSIVLPLDHYAYYDTLAPLTLNVHRVNEEIKTEDGYLYNSSSFGIEEEILGSISLKPRPHQDSIEITLSDVLGKELFAKAVSGSDDLTTSDFLEYIRGFAIVPDTSTSSCILGLTTSPKLKLHYFDRSITPIAERSVEFTVQTSSSLYFTNIVADRTNTFLELFPSAKERLSSMLTNGEAYIQAGAGLSLRVDMPYLNTLSQSENFYPTKAFLEIYPIRKSFGAATPLPAQLNVFLADGKNNIYQDVETTAVLVEDKDLSRDTHYSFDATEFVKAQMGLPTRNENALILTTDKTNYSVSADRVYAGSPSYQYKTRLTIYFATVNN